MLDVASDTESGMTCSSSSRFTLGLAVMAKPAYGSRQLVRRRAAVPPPAAAAGVSVEATSTCTLSPTPCPCSTLAASSHPARNQIESVDHIALCTIAASQQQQLGMRCLEPS